MKVYNINIYSVDHKFAPGSLIHRGHALVKINVFGAREVVTNKKLAICSEDSDFNVNFYKYERDGYLLAIKDTELQKRNLATPQELEQYLNNWEKSDIKEYFEEIKVLPKEEFKKVNEKVKKLQKM